MTSLAIIPIVSLDDSDENATVQNLRHACETFGFFYLQGHGVGSEEIETVMEQSKKLFALPTDVKKALSDPVMSRGYTAMEEETLDPKHQSRGDTKEGFYIGRDIPKEDPRYDPAKLRGPNQWPSKEVSPTLDCDEFQAIMVKYHERISQVAIRVVQLLALALELPRHYFDAYFQEPIASLRLLRYSATKSRPEDGVFACGAHTDYGM